MQFRTITDHLSTGGQIRPTELSDVAKAGFKSVICNRPDGESNDQPSFAEIAESAQKAGLEVRYIPLVAGRVTEADAVLFGKAIAELPGPVLAFCRSGARSTMIWEMSQRLNNADTSNDSTVITKSKTRLAHWLRWPWLGMR